MECIKCRKSDPEPMLSCDGCERPIHHDCSNLSASELKIMALRSKRMLRFYCEDCLTGVKLVPTLIKNVDDLSKEVEKLKNSPVPATTSADYEKLLREMEDRNTRKQNIIIYNFPETPNLSKEEHAAADSQHVKQILDNLSNDITILDKPMRLGSLMVHLGEVVAQQTNVIILDDFNASRYVYKDTSDLRYSAISNFLYFTNCKQTTECTEFYGSCIIFSHSNRQPEISNVSINLPPNPSNNPYNFKKSYFPGLYKVLTYIDHFLTNFMMQIKCVMLFIRNDIPSWTCTSPSIKNLITNIRLGTVVAL
nr:unnamed protein product [Callosobruchus analis]